MFFLRGTGSGCPGGPIAQGDRDRSRHCRGGHQWRQCRSLWSLGLDLLSCIPKIVFAETIFLLINIILHFILYRVMSRNTILYNTICTTDQLFWNLYCHECSTWREKVDRNAQGLPPHMKKANQDFWFIRSPGETDYPGSGSWEKLQDTHGTL